MQIKKQFTINAPMNTVWRIMFEEFASVGKWATAVASSEANPNTTVVGGVELEGRVCATPFGRTVENFTEYNAEAHRFTYEVQNGLPFGIKRAANTWQAKAQGNKTVVTMDLVMETKWVARLMEPMMKMQMNRFMDNLAEEMIHYAETGQIHPRKQKALLRTAAA